MDRLELTKSRSTSLDTFVELYGLEDEAYQLFVEMMEKNIETLVEALGRDLAIAGKEPAMHVPAFLTALALTQFMLGYVTAQISAEF